MQTKIQIFCQEEKYSKEWTVDFGRVGDGDGPEVELDVQGPFQPKAAHGSGRAGLCWGHLALLDWTPGEMGKNLWSGGAGRSGSRRMENPVGWASSEPGVTGELPPCFCLFYILISLWVSTHRVSLSPKSFKSSKCQIPSCTRWTFKNSWQFLKSLPPSWPSSIHPASDGWCRNSLEASFGELCFRNINSIWNHKLTSNSHSQSQTQRMFCTGCVHSSANFL